MDAIEPLTYQDLNIITPFGLYSIDQLKITIRPNEHTTLHLTGRLDSAIESEQALLKLTPENTIEIRNTREEQARQSILYCGLITRASINRYFENYYIALESKSHTFQYDVKLKSRSFQQPGSTYKQIVKEIVDKDYQHGDVIFFPADREINKILLQYQETDWQFFKRIASHFNQPLIPDITAHMPRFYVGMDRHHRKTIEPSEPVNRITRKSIKQYLDLAENNVPGLSQTDFISYTIKSPQIFELGDQLTYRNHTFYISEITRELQNGWLQNTYKLASKNDLAQARIQNPKIIGVSLAGNVLHTDGNTVNINLAIDQALGRQQTIATTNPFHYASQANNILYLMPEIGHDIRLYFPDGEESNAYAIDSVRQNGSTCAKTGDPNIKYWGTPNNKEIKLGYTDLDITAKPDQLYITLDEEKGIEVRSDHDLNITSENAITINSATKINLAAGYNILLQDTGSGSLVKINAEDSSTSVVSADKAVLAGQEGTPTYESVNQPLEAKPAKKKRSWGKLLLKAVAAVAVVAIATAVTVVTFGAAAPLVIATIVAVGAAYGAYKTIQGHQPGDSLLDTVYDFLDYTTDGMIVTGAVFTGFGVLAAPFIAASTLTIGQAMLAAGFTGGLLDFWKQADQAEGTSIKEILGEIDPFEVIDISVQSTMLPVLAYEIYGYAAFAALRYSPNLVNWFNSVSNTMGRFLGLSNYEEIIGGEEKVLAKPTGADWNEFFKEKYGAENVEWLTKSGRNPDFIPYENPYFIKNVVDGGLIKEGLGKISGNSYQVSQQNINAIENHLNSTGMTSVENSAMINRLENALQNGENITGADASFLLHELKEASLMQSGMPYETAHQDALDYYEVSPYSVYDPSVIQQFPDLFNSNWFKFWGISK